MATVLARYCFAFALLAALMLLLAADVAAVRPTRVVDPQRAAQIIRPATVSIDTSPQPEVIEGQTLRFTVRRSRVLRERTAVTYRLDNITLLRRAMPSAIIDSGQLTGEILVPTLDDAILNGDRNIVVTLLGASSGASMVKGQATGVIHDNEVPPVPTADIDAAPVPSVTEGETLALTVRLRAAVKQATSVRYRIIDESGATDAVPVSGLTIPAGSTEFPLRIATRDDDVVNGERTVQVQLIAISGNGDIGVARVQAVVLDNDREPEIIPIIPRFSVLPNGNAVEGEELTFTIFTDAPVPVTRRVAVQITAPENALIEPIPSNVLLRAGETSTLLTLLTADDAEVGAPRLVSVTLLPGEALTIDPAQSSASSMINDNDELVPLDPDASSGDSGEEDFAGSAPAPAQGFGATLMQGPIPAIAFAVLLLVAGIAGIRRFVLPRFYKVGWALGLPLDVDATSSGEASLLPPGGGVEVELGIGEATIVGPCPILSEEERDDPDELD